MVRAVFIGMPGSGKSSIGRRVANRLGVGFEDTDSLIERSTGKKIADLFRVGEDHFRQIEAATVAKAMDGFDGILSLGGGAILDAGTRALLREVPVVLVDASDEVLAARVEHGRSARPLLASRVGQKIARLRAERAALYYENANIIVDSSRFSTEHTTSVVVNALLNPPVVRQINAEHSYDVVIGRAVAPLAARCAAKYAAGVVVTSPDVVQLANQIATSMKQLGTPATVLTLPRGEEAKTVTVLETIWDRLHEMGVSRDGVVVAVGGGATTDVGGFASATWLRGLPWISVPTTLLGMVDAAVGGKTGINMSFGKNLIGAFHSPVGVFADFDVLATLPLPKLREGMGEVIKCGLISKSSIIETVLEQKERILDPTSFALNEVAVQAISLKAQIVSADLHESGQREFLNYGHTLAHALEAASGYTMAHGEAVAIGCVFAAELAVAEGLADPKLANLHRDLFSAVGLPISAPNANRRELLKYMFADKKVRDGQLRFVVLSDVGEAHIVTAPDGCDRAFDAIGVE
ncbi:3-dehydroquinate synthase [Arcanobacterium canis]|uniref:Multifunctional fusion protein n=1 Tax=Arcanobacterium canis TaxID=999183 RepID=A0ABY8G0F6_9ACTO|nr:3-dehydroquinate synthase [Arcanobacterium canis]WFM82646.1 3-dehydroquinate synthase [Arcanobacterium canis]